MLLYYMQCRTKKTESKNPRVAKTNEGKLMLLWKCVVCGSKKLRFIKNHEVSRLLSKLTLKTFVSKIPLLDDILF